MGNKSDICLLHDLPLSHCLSVLRILTDAFFQFHTEVIYPDILRFFPNFLC